jgi:hypothetical protein
MEPGIAFAVDLSTGKELSMPRPTRETRAEVRSGNCDFLQVAASKGTNPSASTAQSKRPDWPPVPDLFDVITYFRARGDSFTLIASIGFWVGDEKKHSARAASSSGTTGSWNAEPRRRHRYAKVTGK